METTERARIQERIDYMADGLFEDVDAVVILVSVIDHDTGQTVTHALTAGRGNHHTRQGLAYHYLAMTTERANNN